MQAASAAEDTRPNILWIFVDDMSANVSCYGETLIETPHVDRLAREGTQFSSAFVTAPVCSTCRSALITGMYQTSIGAHHHRSGRGALQIQLPENVRLVPEFFQDAGYYTCIGDGLNNDTRKRLGKTDYNFDWDPSVYDGHDWSGRADDQPFFMQVQLRGGKLRGGTTESALKLLERAKAEFGSSTDPADVTLPPFYPDNDVLRTDWAAYLDAVRFTDQHVGSVLQRLEEESILDRTLVLFVTDHGISHARGKQFLYDEGTHVPFVVRGPGIPEGVVRDDLIEHIDMAAISLAAAGIEIPSTMHARDVFDDDYRRRAVVFAARDRCDETVDRIRSVRSDQFLYIRNFYPHRPLLQPNAYKDKKSILIALRECRVQGTLPELSEDLLFAEERPAEEFYEWKKDRWQVRNLAGEPLYAEVLRAHRNRLDRWMEETQDHGAESEAMYDSDMAVYLRKGNPAVQANIATMKRWAAEGR